MALLLTLGRGALTGIGKKPSAGAALPHRRLTEPDVRIDPARMARYAEVCGYSPRPTGCRSPTRTSSGSRWPRASWPRGTSRCR